MIPLHPWGGGVRFDHLPSLKKRKTIIVPVLAHRYFMTCVTPTAEVVSVLLLEHFSPPEQKHWAGMVLRFAFLP